LFLSFSSSENSVSLRPHRYQREALEKLRGESPEVREREDAQQ
jgi:hypothetical protein